MLNSLDNICLIIPFLENRKRGAVLRWAALKNKKRLNHSAKFSREVIKMDPWTIDTVRGFVGWKIIIKYKDVGCMVQPN